MRLSRCSAMLSFAVMALCSIGFADTITFSAATPGDLGVKTQTFTSGSSSITLTGYLFDAIKSDLYFKDGKGGEKGIGLTGTAHNEIGPGFVQFLSAGVDSLLLSSLQPGEEWALYGSSAAGATEDTLIATGTGKLVNLSGDDGYTYISIGAANGDFLIKSARVEDNVRASEPGTPALMMTLGLVGLFVFNRRKLFT